MYTSLRPLIALSLALLATLLALPASAQVNLQIIHNAADPLVQEVDVYVGGELTLDDFAFRTATSFLELPADTDLLVQLAPANSASADDAVFAQTYNLPGGSYQLIASGVLALSLHEPNPDGVDIGLRLLSGLNARQASGADDAVAVRVVHGATDAPTVDVRSGGAVLVDDASYLDVTPYQNLPPDAYTLDVTTADGAPVASFGADLSEAGGAAVTVLASGFLTPLDDQDGPAFGLLAVFADGATALLPAAVPPARVQVIHNAPDPAAAVVDVYVDGDLALDDVAFRTATPYLDFPGDAAVDIAIAPGSSAGVDDALYTQSFTLEAGEAYRLVALGVLDPSGFASNPGGEPIAFQLQPATGLGSGHGLGGVALSVGHGAPDAPAVTIETPAFTVAENLSYGEIAGYLAAPAAPVRILVSTAAGTPLASYDADLSGRDDQSVSVLASGFVSPADNQNGPGFGLLAVFSDGTTALLPETPSAARLQIIHNAPDPAALVVDVYVNGERLLDDFAFRTATPFIDVDANTDLTIAVAPGASSSADDAVYTEGFQLEAGAAAQLIAQGVLIPETFAPNPDGRLIRFELRVGIEAEETAGADEVAVRVVHGAPDAPAVDIRSGGDVLVDDAAYADVTGYLALPAATYRLDVTTADGAPVASFDAPLADAGGQAVTVLASGFLSPADNQNGPAFELLAAFADGTTLLLPTATDAEPSAGLKKLALGLPAPHPVASVSRIAFTLDEPGAARVQLFDLLGRRVATLADGEFTTDRVEIAIDGARLAPGAYLVRLDAASGVRTRVVSVVR